MGTLAMDSSFRWNDGSVGGGVGGERGGSLAMDPGLRRDDGSAGGDLVTNGAGQ